MTAPFRNAVTIQSLLSFVQLANLNHNSLKVVYNRNERV